MVEAKKTTAKKSSASVESAAKVTALEARVAVLESYIRMFDNFLSNTMISNTIDPAANESLGEIAASIE